LHGAFYTPDDLDTVLLLALRDGGNDLGPSFGGCAVLRAAVNVLGERSQASSRSVFASTWIPIGGNSPQGLVSDELLTVISGAFSHLAPRGALQGGGEVISILRHHWLKGDAAAARAAAASTGVRLQETRALGVLRVHSLSFLAPEVARLFA
jgi:hypothetical protein